MRRASGIAGLIRFIVIFFVGGLILLGIGIFQLSIKNATPMDIYDMSISDYKNNVHIVSDIQCIYGEFYTQTTERKTLGVTTSSSESARGYAIGIFDPNGYYIENLLGLKLAKKSDYPIMDKMIAESDEWYYDQVGYEASHFMKTTYHIDGRLRKMKDKEYNLLVSALGMTKEEASQYIIPYMIEPIYGGEVAFFVTGAIFLGVGVVIVVSGKRNQKREQEAEEARMMYQRQQGTYDPNMQQNYANPTDQIIVNGQTQNNDWNQ